MTPSRNPIKPVAQAKDTGPRLVYRGGRRPKSQARKWTWGSSAVEQVDKTVVEVDEAIEADVWRLSIDTPDCHASVQIDGRKQLGELLEFLGRSDQPHSVGPVTELELGQPQISWVWDDETPGRLFLWLNRTDMNSMRTVLDRQQVTCIRSALMEAAK